MSSGATALPTSSLLERAEGVGGTWHFNTYPGCACDVPSHMYSYSFEQRRGWSRLCSPQEEILDYVHQVARDYGIDRLVQTGTEVTACEYSDEQRRWTVSAADGRRWEADAVIVATGQLHQPAIPRLSLTTTPSPATAFTPRAGTTTTTCAASGWR